MPEKTFLPILVFCVLVLLGARWMPRWALKRPALLGVLSAALTLWGILCLNSLPVELMPNAGSQTVTVTISVRGGMAPLDVEALIARPLEEALGDLPRLKDILASAKKDRCAVSLLFEPGVDMKWATAQVHERMERVVPRLPPEIEAPVVAHFEESDSPVYIAAFTSPSMSPESMRRVIEERIKDRLQRAPGVANVEVGGGRERKILVEVDRDKLLAHRLSIQKIASLLGRRNVAVQAGSVGGGRTLSPIRFVGTFHEVSEMGQVVVGRDAGGGMTLLENVATVTDSHAEPESLSRFNGRAAVSLYIQKESAANARQAARAAEKALEEAWRQLPPSLRGAMEMVTVSNQAVAIESAVASLRMSLASGVLLIVLVLCLFQGENARPLTRRVAGAALALVIGAMTVASVLKINANLLEAPLWALLAAFTAWAGANRDLRPAFIVGGAIPLSLLFSFILFKLCGVSLNAMSFFGLALGIGMLVDNGIVVFESISHRGPARAAEAAEEVVMPLIGATATNAVVFVPFLFLSQDLRILYTDVAVAVTAALFGSVAVALTAVTVLTARSLAADASPAPQPLKGRVGRAARWIENYPLDERLWKPLRRLGRAAGKIGTRVLDWAPLRASLAAARRENPYLLILYFLGAFAALQGTGWPGPAKGLFSAGAAAAAVGGFVFFRRYGTDWREIHRRRFQVLAWAAALSAAAFVILGWGMERDFQTSGEADEFVVFVELSSGARLGISDDIVKDVERQVLAAAGGEVKTLVSRVEGWSSKVYVTLKPRAERKLATEQVVDLLRKTLKNAGRDKDGNAFVHFSSPRSGAEIGVQVSGPDYEVLEGLAQKVTAEMSKIRGLEDVKMRYRPGRPEVWARVDPVRAALHGLTAESVAETAHALMRGLRATTFRSGGQQIETIVRLRARDREDLASLPDLPLLSASSSQLRLGNVADLQLTKMPNEISRRNRQRLIEITANRAGLSLGSAAQQVQKALDGMKFPLEYYASIDGDYQEMAGGLRQLAWGVGVMVLLIYLVLVLLFESMVQPLVIMTTVPLCVVGAVWGLVLFRTPLTTGVLVGVMMLGGIVVNNALMLLDRFNADPPPPGDPAALASSLFGAAHDRMRPIFLTAASGVLDFLPMMLDTSESGVLWRPLSITMVFGLLISTVLTLYVVPCMAYVLLEDAPRFFVKQAARLKFTLSLQVVNKDLGNP